MEKYENIIEEAINKTINAWKETEKAFLTHDKEGFETWHNKFCRYVELFSGALRIPEERFVALLEQKGLYQSEIKTGSANNSYFETLKVRLYQSCDLCNRYAECGDQNRNHVNYGAASAIARTMTDFGHKVDVPVWEDGSVLRIPKIVIDGELFIDFEKKSE